MKNLFFLLIILCFTSCENKTKNHKVISTKEKTLNTLFHLMQGSFNSKAQAKTDSTYYDVSLNMVAIWQNKGHYIYAEQTLEGMKVPYRQHVYELKSVTDSTIASYIYKLPNDSLWVGKWKTSEFFNNIAPKDLIIKNGCETIIKQIDSSLFIGALNNSTCKNSLMGASTVKSYIEINKNKILSWDRGFDANGKQVWGSKKGGYIFIKTK